MRLVLKSNCNLLLLACPVGFFKEISNKILLLVSSSKFLELCLFTSSCKAEKESTIILISFWGLLLFLSEKECWFSASKPYYEWFELTYRKERFGDKNVRSLNGLFDLQCYSSDSNDQRRNFAIMVCTLSWWLQSGRNATIWANAEFLILWNHVSRSMWEKK